MKTKQKPTAAGTAAVAAAAAARCLPLSQRGKEEETARQPRQRSAQPQCERERRHEAARREREEQTQTQTHTQTQSTLHRREQAARKASQPLRRLSKDRVSAKVVTHIGKTVPTAAKTVPTTTRTVQKLATIASKAARTTAKTVPTVVKDAASTVPNVSTSSSSNNEETAQLKLQLEHLTQLSEQDFEREFRKWLIQAAVAGTLQPQLRTDLIHSFNSTTLGQLFHKTSTFATAARTHQPPQCLLLSPLALALHTLVAEFLYAHNCRYTLSVFCSEMSQRHTLPDFDTRTDFRFSQAELQQLLAAVLGTRAEQLQLGQRVQQQYDKPEQSLLLALVSALLDKRAKDTTAQEELLDNGQAVFVGPRIGQSLNSVDQQMGQLMETLRSLCKSCAPPVEVISSTALEQLLQRELNERERLTSLGQSYPPEQTVLKLSEHTTPPKTSAAKGSKETTVPSTYGAIQLPTTSPVVPRLPQLHEQQVASLVTVQQTLAQLSQKLQLPHECMIQELQRLEEMVGQLASCMHSLSNVLNLAMEQEYAVGRNKGYKLGYREGFNHGHFMGVQEGEQLAQAKHKQQQEKEQQLQAPSQPKRDASSQTLTKLQTSATQTRHKNQRQAYTNTEQPEEPKEGSAAMATKDAGTQSRRAASSQDAGLQCHLPEPARTPPSAQEQHSQTVRAATQDAGVQTLAACTDASVQTCTSGAVASRNAGVQTSSTRARSAGSARGTAVSAERSYEQWIFEMLHSQSGLIFLERVELSLNKALEMQKRRLDELFEVKQRHHGELIRLNRRQKSWRTLCKHVERDTDSTEANELAQRIFRLLEHYEAHHKLLSAKIQETELAAEQTARIEPVWNDSMCSAGAASTQPARPQPTLAPVQPKSVTEPHSLLALALASAKPAAQAAAPLISTAAMAPTPIPASPTVPPTTPPTVQSATAPASETPARPPMRSVATNTCQPSQLPAAEARPNPAVSSFQEALTSAKTRMLQLEQESNLLEQSFLGYLERARAQNQKFNIRASCARERQQLHRTLDSFREWQRRIQHEDLLQPSQVLPAVVSPVCSAAEQEPDSYQFTNAIALARQKLLAELQVSTLPSAGALELPGVARGGSDADKLLIDQMQSETQQLLSRMEATLARAVKPANLQTRAPVPRHDEPLLELELDTLSSVTATSLTGIESGAGGDDGVTHKLQRSMAKMQRLFGSHAEPTGTAAKAGSYVPLRMPATRPWSAPTAKLSAACLPALLPTRPHTAPSSRTHVPPGAPAAATNLIHLLDALSDVGDSTVYSSSLGSSLDMAAHSTAGGLPEVYAQLVANATTPSPTHASSSPTLSHSLDFWKRMNL